MIEAPFNDDDTFSQSRLVEFNATPQELDAIDELAKQNGYLDGEDHPPEYIEVARERVLRQSLRHYQSSKLNLLLEELTKMAPKTITPNSDYWCILPSVESEGYGDEKPRQPWRGRYYQEHRSGGIVHLISSVSSETGEIDDDTNATALIPHDDCDKHLFENQADAWGAYEAALWCVAGELAKEVCDIIVQAQNAHKTREELLKVSGEVEKAFPKVAIQTKELDL